MASESELDRTVSMLSVAAEQGFYPAPFPQVSVDLDAGNGVLIVSISGDWVSREDRARAETFVAVRIHGAMGKPLSGNGLKTLRAEARQALRDTYLDKLEISVVDAYRWRFSDHGE